MAEEPAGQTQLRLGIDTGGTYTDAALVDAEDHVVASGKSLTTHSQLEIGISAVLKKLPSNLLSNVTLTSLSTTLATNAVVEGRGTPVCLLLPGYTARQIERAKLELIVRGGACVTLAGERTVHLTWMRRVAPSRSTGTEYQRLVFRVCSAFAIPPMRLLYAN